MIGLNASQWGGVSEDEQSASSDQSSTISLNPQEIKFEKRNSDKLSPQSSEYIAVTTCGVHFLNTLMLLRLE